MAREANWVAEFYAVLDDSYYNPCVVAFRSFQRPEAPANRLESTSGCSPGDPLARACKR